MANQPLAGKLNAVDEQAGNHSIQKDELNPSNRIREAVGDESVASFSRRCGIGDSTIRKYLDGALPNSSNLVAIADAANVNIEWLAAGRGPKMRGASPDGIPTTAQIVAATTFDDMDRLQLSINTVQEALAIHNKILTPAKHALCIGIAYKLLENRANRESIVDLIKMAA